MIRRVIAAAVTVLAGCGGEQVLVETPTPSSSAAARGLYLEGEGMEVCGPSAIARGLWLNLTPVAVDDANHALLAVAAELSITDTDGAPVPFEQVTDRFRTRFVRTGTYVLTATFGDGARVSREVTVVERAGVRLGQAGRQVVTHDASGDCTQSVSDELVPRLALNQELHTWIMPVDAQDRPLLGLLELGFSGTASAREWAPGAPVNRYIFEPTRSGTNELTIADTELQLELRVSFEADNAPARCAAP